MALVCAGLVSLWAALGVQQHALAWTARFGALCAAAAAALYAVLQAVDGVALKQAVDAWVAAPEPEKAARFAAAEGIRWLEWGVRSYHSILLGSALVLLGVVVGVTRHVSRTIGWLMALSGLAYMVQGWIIGDSGFSAANALPTLAGIVAIAAWTAWLFVSAVRMKNTTPAGHPR
ncbi:hypothetical protein ACFFGR_13510 [Arthrobacter liuii]|nr:hypothetical protein [Arthrobacter liuii]